MQFHNLRATQPLPLNILGWSILCAMMLVSSFGLAEEETGEFFEQHVRPLLIEKCSRCHGSEEQSGGLRVDSRVALIEGGATSPAIVPGDIAGSLLMQAVRREGDLAMPPDEALSDSEIRVLQHWIEMGAPWPHVDHPLAMAASRAADGKHWAFQPLHEPDIPVVENIEWIRTPVDAFIMAKLEQQHLSASPVADRRTLIRRVTYALTGLPPSPADVEQFVNDSHVDAYERLVECLLAAPQYGEQWARHWLDVARYSDTKGYVYAREERYWVHAWAYRDWVVQALNRDMPYDRFLLLQLAADQVEEREQFDLAAMGFLTLGRRFLGVRRDIIDDRIDVVCRGTMGLTVSCARCHDHKYDPIPAADYYSLYGVFDSCVERLVPLQDSAGDEEFEQELRKRQEKLQTQLALRRDESSRRVRERVADYLFAQSELHKYPANGFDQIFQKDDLLPDFVRHWEEYLRRARNSGDPVFAAWLAYAEIPAESFATRAADVTSQLSSRSAEERNEIIARAFAQPPASLREVCDRYGAVFADIQQQWETACSEAQAQGNVQPECLADADAEAVRRVLYGPHSPCEVPEGPIVQVETYFDSDSCTELWKLQGEVDRQIINANRPVHYGLLLVDQTMPAEPRIFVRGNPLNLGKEVPRQFLSVLAGRNREPFAHGSGRYELAQLIIAPDNPLTARVIVNRIWAGHFGQGLVSTPSDFGTRAELPSHPELLDWLATKFIEEGWSLKQLHRKIVLSAAFRQSSFGPVDVEARQVAQRVDPNNRLLWHMHSRRLSFEEFRDSLLAAANQLDSAVGGKPTELLTRSTATRRTLYGLVDRQYLPGAMRVFDFANPDLHVSQRNETTVPQQALFFMNHAMVLERAQALARMVRACESPQEAVDKLFQQVFQRPPNASEVVDAVALVEEAKLQTTNEHAARATVADWQYGYGKVDAEAQRVVGFKPLPHFTGQAWQGGSKWPDAKLGWVQLTAGGGHPGNDRDHAAVRRWTASSEMTIKINSDLKHEPTQGDGIRAFIISSRSGMMHSLCIHHDSRPLNIKSLTVSAGETIDFVVDIGDQLNNDQYLWNVTIEAAEDGLSPQVWNSLADFTQEAIHRLDPWEQLAQVLLCANEFMFVD